MGGAWRSVLSGPTTRIVLNLRSFLLQLSVLALSYSIVSPYFVLDKMVIVVIRCDKVDIVSLSVLLLFPTPYLYPVTATLSRSCGKSAPLFSSTYELLVPQLPRLQEHLRCPMLFSKSLSPERGKIHQRICFQQSGLFEPSMLHPSLLSVICSLRLPVRPDRTPFCASVPLVISSVPAPP